jgi:hypothetical protein
MPLYADLFSLGDRVVTSNKSTLTNQLRDGITAWNRLPLGKIMFLLQVKKKYGFYRSPRFIKLSVRSLTGSLGQMKLLHALSSSAPILILSFHINLGNPIVPFSVGFPNC